MAEHGTIKGEMSKMQEGSNNKSRIQANGKRKGPTVLLQLLLSLFCCGLILTVSAPYSYATTEEEGIESEPDETETEEVVEEEPEETEEVEEEETETVTTEPEDSPEVEEEEENKSKEQDGGIFGPGGPCYNPDDEDRCIEDDPCVTSYPDFCIKPKPPDLNCDDIGKHNFKVTGSDPHGFDHDKDGIGCEDNSKPTNKSGNGGKGGDDDIHIDINVKEEDNDNSKKDNKSVEQKFQVIVILNETDKVDKDDQFRMRVIAYGPNTLNKPTLDKPGQLVDLKTCVESCYTLWGFTARKVPLDTLILACVWNIDNGNKTCGWGNSDSKYGPEVITISFPQGIGET
jgi:hypothetical protein